jgi:ribonuclease VapC
VIVVDTSAVVAIVAGEPEAEAIAEIMGSRNDFAMSTGTRLELGIVARAKWGGEGKARVEAVLSEMRISYPAFDERQMQLATEAHRRFGGGSGHPARLNFGDCFAYALARALDAPLLFKGDDFVHTDVRSALPSSP